MRSVPHRERGARRRLLSPKPLSPTNMRELRKAKPLAKVFLAQLEKRRWLVVFAFFLALSFVSFREPLLQTDPRYFELSHDLEVPMYLDNIFASYGAQWNPHQSIANLVKVYQIQLLLPFLAVGWVARPPPMSLIELILVGAQVASGFNTCYASYVLLARSFPDKSRLCFLASIVSGLFGMFNPLWASDPRHVNTRLTFAFIPLLVLTLVLGFSQKRYRYIVGAAFFWSLISGSIRIIVAGGILLAWFFILYSLADIIQRRGSLAGIVQYLRLAIVMIGTYIFFTCFRILPTALGLFTGRAAEPYPPIVEGAIKGSYQSTLANMLRFDVDLNPRPFEPLPPFLNNPMTQLAFYILSFTVFSACVASFYLWKKNRDLLFLGSSLILFTALSTAVNPYGFPGVRELFMWLMFGAPLSRRFFFLFRNPNMVRVLPTVFAALVLGFAVYWLLKQASRIKIPRFSRALPIALIAIITLSIFTSSWPMLTGNFNGDLKPVRVPDQYFAVNDWLKETDGDFKVVWMPKYGGTPFWSQNKIRRFEDISSSMPTYVVWGGPFSQRPIESYLKYLMSFNLKYRFDVTQANRTANLGKLLAPLNVRYLIFNTRAPVDANLTSVLMTLESQRDLQLVRADDFLYVFEIQNYAKHVYGLPRLVLVDGGRETMTALSQIESFDPTTTALYFIQQADTERAEELLRAADTIILEDPSNLLPLFVPDESILAPARFSIHNDPTRFWAFASTSDPRFGRWTAVLGSEHLQLWQFDYGRGLVYTSTNATLDMPFNVDEDGEYEIYVRYLEKSVPGAIEIAVDGRASWTRDTQSSVTRFTFERIGEHWLSRGSHNLRLANLSGFNAVNLLIVASRTDLDTAEARIDTELNSKNLAYMSLPGSDLQFSNGEIVTSFGGIALNGRALELRKDGVASTRFYIPSDGSYTLDVRMLPSEYYQIRVELGPLQYYFSSTMASNITHLTIPVSLKRGSVWFRIQTMGGRPTLDMVSLFSSNNRASNLDDLLRCSDAHGPEVQFQQLDPTRFRVKVNASRPFILALAESFDTSWIVRLEQGGTIRPFALDSAINGFVIDKVGSFDVLIEFEGEPWFEAGAVISAASSLVFILYWILTLHNRKSYVWDRFESSLRRMRLKR